MAFPRQRLPPLGHILREPIPCLIPKGGIYRSPTGEDPVGMPYEQEGNPMPQPFKNAVMTNAGANLLTRAQLGSTQIEFTRMATGNGTYNEDEKRLDALQQQESLKSEKNSYALSSIHIHTEKSIKITALITNQDPDTEETLVEEGYYINEVGLYAKELGGDSSTEVLYSISVTSGENGDFMPPYNGFSPAQIIQDYYVTVNNSAEVTIKSGMGAVALADDLQNLNRAVEQQNIAAQEQFQQQYEQLTGYTDTKIGELINGAPETLDTIKEVADAILENETIVEALNEAVGKKLNKDGDLTDTTVTFTSEDDEDPTAWTAMRKIVSGKLKDILGSVSTMAKNLNYLRKMLGTEDISKMGDGTLTGAVSKLNTDLSYKDIKNEITILKEGTTFDSAYVKNGIAWITGRAPAGFAGVIDIAKISAPYAPRTDMRGIPSYNASYEDIGKMSSICMRASGKMDIFFKTPLDYAEIFVIIYPLK